MCGLAGIIRIHPPGDPPPPADAISSRWLDTLDQAIAHRGPDGKGRFRDRVPTPTGGFADIALVHRRLSIIDHQGGAQPMLLMRNGNIGSQPPKPSKFDSCASDHHTNQPPTAPVESAIAFNGCIYNHRELRHVLEQEGVRFTTHHSDTEALLRGWARWGIDVLPKTEGMLAAAFWSRQSATLTLARDRFGEKPLYWHSRDNLVAFASTAAALGRLMGQMPGGLRVNSEGMIPWVHAGYATGGIDLMEIHEVRPGEWVEFGGRDWVRRGQWASIASSGQTAGPSQPAQDAVGMIDGILGDAVAARLEADVPIACFLSGGIDSSLVASWAKRHAGRLTTLCVRMPEGAYDESAEARAVAAHVGSEHREVIVEGDASRDLELLITHMGLPFGDSSLLPAYWVSRALGGGVALGGDGGDELFIGYERQWAAGYLRGLWRAAARAFGPAALVFLDESDPRGRSSKLARLIRAASEGSYASLGAITQCDDLEALIGREALAGLHADPERGDAVRAAQIFDLTVALPGDLLRKTDTASMCAGVELRSPFLDRALAAAALATPVGLLGMPTGTTRKGLLREVARKHLPAGIIDRPKQGFAIPIGSWFRSDHGGLRTLLRDRLLSSDPFCGLDGGLIDRGVVARWMREHDEARAGRGRDHSQRLFALLTLSLWCEQARGWMGAVKDV